MKNLILIFTLALALNAHSQATDTIDVCFDKSCYLVFDDDVTFDFGSQGIIVRSADNKIIIQAAEEGFPETNLLVQCKSQYFLFIIRYRENPKKLFYNYQSSFVNGGNNKGGSSSSVNSVKTGPGNGKFVDHKIEDQKKREEFIKDSLKAHYEPNCEKVMTAEQDIFNRGTAVGKMQFLLTNLFIGGDDFYLKLSIINKSKIPYNIGFIEHKVESVKRTIKGSADQIVGIKPLYVFNNGGVVEGRKSLSIVVVIKKIAIQTDKKLVVDMWEDNGSLDTEGGRKLSIDILSRDILNVKKIPTKNFK